MAWGQPLLPHTLFLTLPYLKTKTKGSAFDGSDEEGVRRERETKGMSSIDPWSLILRPSVAAHWSIHVLKVWAVSRV